VKTDAAKSRPTVLALVGSPRRQGNTVSAVHVAAQELGRRGLSCEIVMLCDFAPGLLGDVSDGQIPVGAGDRTEALLEKVWAADGLILATPVHFCNVSAQMKAFMDSTNDRYMRQEWLAPQTIGLLVVGAQGGFTATIEALQRYLDLVAPSHPTIEVASAHADAVGEAQRSHEVREAARTMAVRMADVLLRSSASASRTVA
jgi:multimeric flavodoxin WrbA